MEIYRFFVYFINSVDARDRPFHEAERWSDENVFGNRAYFRSSSSPAALAIENVMPEDGAIYKCRVDFRIAQTRNTKVNLTVIGKLTFQNLIMWEVL